MTDHPTDDDRTTDVPQEELDELDTETVEDLDADEDADDVRGGITFRCVQ